VLADPPDNNPFATDTVNTIDLFMNVGADQLQSVTELEMLNGANAAAVLKVDGTIEVIQYQNVTQNADGSFTLDTLLRGRRGTDAMTNDHTIAEPVVLLTGATGDLFRLLLSEISTPILYKGVGSGQIFEEGENLSLTSEHRALKPYAPVNVVATLDVSDNIDFVWDRRTRVGGDLQDLIGEVPLNEDTEEYEIDILDGPGGTIVRTVTGLTTAEYEYTNANIISDLGSVPATIDVRIYQISAQIGRGFTREVSLDVQ
jgi:hypothetical protein